MHKIMFVMFLMLSVPYCLSANQNEISRKNLSRDYADIENDRVLLFQMKNQKIDTTGMVGVVGVFVSMITFFVATVYAPEGYREAIQAFCCVSTSGSCGIGVFAWEQQKNKYYDLSEKIHIKEDKYRKDSAPLCGITISRNETTR